MHKRGLQLSPCLSDSYLLLFTSPQSFITLIFAMKVFTLIALAFATAAVATPSPIDLKRQISLPHIVCIPSGSSLAIIDEIYDLLDLPLPNPLACNSTQTCTDLTIPFIGQFIGVSKSPYSQASFCLLTRLHTDLPLMLGWRFQR